MTGGAVHKKTLILLAAALVLSGVVAAEEPAVDLEAVAALAVKYGQSRTPEKEIERLRAVVKDDPWNDEMWARLGWLHLALNDAAAAERCAPRRSQTTTTCRR